MDTSATASSDCNTSWSCDSNTSSNPSAGTCWVNKEGIVQCNIFGCSFAHCAFTLTIDMARVAAQTGNTSGCFCASSYEASDTTGMRTSSGVTSTLPSAKSFPRMTEMLLKGKSWHTPTATFPETKSWEEGLEKDVVQGQLYKTFSKAFNKCTWSHSRPFREWQHTFQNDRLLWSSIP